MSSIVSFGLDDALQLAIQDEDGVLMNEESSDHFIHSFGFLYYRQYCAETPDTILDYQGYTKVCLLVIAKALRTEHGYNASLVVSVTVDKGLVTKVKLGSKNGCGVAILGKGVVRNGFNYIEYKLAASVLDDAYEQFGVRTIYTVPKQFSEAVLASKEPVEPLAEPVVENDNTIENHLKEISKVLHNHSILLVVSVGTSLALFVILLIMVVVLINSGV